MPDSRYRPGYPYGRDRADNLGFGIVFVLAAILVLLAVAVTHDGGSQRTADTPASHPVNMALQ